MRQPDDQCSTETGTECGGSTAGVPAHELLDVLGDTYARTILRVLADHPRSGTDIAEMTSMSKPTAFRRLNRLSDLGIVSARTCIDPDHGHHHEVYELSVEGVQIDLEKAFERVESNSTEAETGCGSADVVERESP